MKLTHSLAPIGIAVSLGLTGCSGGGGQPDGDASAQAAPAAAASLIRDVTVEDAGALIAGDKPVVVLDVRTPAEYAEGHIAGAVNVDFMSEDFAEKLAELDPAASYVLHCKSGGRSTKALEVLKANSFTDIAHMKDGFDGWAAAGQPVAK